MPPKAAATHYQQRVDITDTTLKATRRVWAKVNTASFDQAWRTAGPQLLMLVSAAQTAAARDGVAYSSAIAAELGFTADPVGVVSVRALVGVASDGRDLASLLYEPLIQVFEALGNGATVPSALSTGGSSLDRIVSTQVADAGRAAVSVGMTARPAITGYVRMLNLPSCERCTVLAGKFYAWNVGFLRHPQCDCTHIPATEDVAGDLTTDVGAAIRSGQVRGLSKADAHAIIVDGADPAQVINAKRSMSTEQVFGRLTKVTREGITSRGVAGKLLGRSSKGVRLRPESIYKLATDRDDAIRLLRRYGYLT